MALNYSHRPIFPAHMVEDNLISPMRIVNGYLVEGIPERNGECNYGRDRLDGCGSSNSVSVSKDIADLLPSDPFGMDISTTFTAITGWLEDLEADYGRRNFRAANEDYDLFAGFNFIWNNAMRFQTFPVNTYGGYKQNTTEQVNLQPEDRNHGSALASYDFVTSFEDGEGSGNRETRENQVVPGKLEGAEFSCDATSHEGWTVVLPYLGIKDFLSLEMVCRSLQYTVRSDPLFWGWVHIEKPLNEKITDDNLLQLSNRAQGNLQCLSLLECTRITDDGLRRVLESNPQLNKLCVAGCTRMNIEGILNILRDFNKGGQGIRYLRIGGLYGITHEHFEELQHLLGTEECPEKEAYKVRKPRFYVRENIYVLFDDNRSIDVEVCPKCQKLRLVYDCPFEGCRVKDGTPDSCRACSLCIARCIQCGRCISDNEYEETFCLELLCADCLTK